MKKHIFLQKKISDVTKRIQKISGLISLVLFVFIFSVGCNPKLAELDSGSITKKDLQVWLNQFYPNKNQQDQIWKNINYQKNLVRHIAITKIARDEAIAKKFNETSQYKTAWKIERDRYIMNVYRQDLEKQFQDNKSFQVPVVKSRHILFRVSAYKTVNKKNVPLTPTEKEKAFQAAEKKAAEVILQLNKGARFEEMAKKYSDCPSKSKGGDLGYFTRKNMMVEPFAQAAFALEIGKISTPVRSNFGVHIIRTDEKKEVTEKNLASLFPDKGQQDRFKGNIRSLRMENHYDSLRKKITQPMDLAVIKKAATNDIVFISEDVKLTKGQFMEIVSQTFRTSDKTKINDGQLSSGIDFVTRMVLYVADAEKTGFTKRSEIQEKIEKMEERFLASQYLNDLRDKYMAGLTISEDRIKLEYKRRYMTQPHMLKDMRKSIAKQTVPTLEKVKESIVQQLKRQEENNYMNRMIEGKLKERKYKLLLENFKAQGVKPVKKPSTPNQQQKK